jgi:uncharacterized damage-inducible protein DinB
MDLLDRLLQHDAWTTGRVLDFVQALPDEQLDQKFDVGHGTIRETLRHMVGNIEVWMDLMAERPVRDGPQGPRDAAALRKRFEAGYAEFGALARKLRDGGRLNEQYPDVLDKPPRQKSFGGTILHVITHNHQHRAELIHLLARQGVTGLIEGDVLSWEAANSAARPLAAHNHRVTK